jgi:hypothetical protein
MNETTIANTILSQLGGGKFVAMTGAKNLGNHGNALSFRLPGNPGFVRKGINYVKITLTAADLYNVEFGKIRGLKYSVLETVDGLYHDQLGEVFRSTTGLETRMPRVFIK